MLKHEEMSNPDSCLNRAAPDEPIFVLRAKDAVAAMTVLHWATMAHTVHGQDKREEARQLAEQMTDWRNRHTAVAEK